MISEHRRGARVGRDEYHLAGRGDPADLKELLRDDDRSYGVSM